MKNNNIAAIQELGQSAISAMNIENYSEAEKKLLQVLAIDPNEFNAINLLAYLATVKGDLLKAIDYLEVARSIRPLDSTTLLNLGKAYFDVGDYSNSILINKIFKDNFLFNPEVALDIALAYEKLGDVISALGECTELLQNCQQCIAAWQLLSNLYLKLGKLVESKEAALLALKMDSFDAGSWISLGNAQYDLRDYKEAIEAFKKAADLSPKLSIPWTNIGNCYLKLGDYGQSISAHLHSIKLERNPETYYNLGVAYGRAGDFENAVMVYDQLLKIEPNNSQAMLNKGLALLQLGQFECGWDLYENRFEVGNSSIDQYSKVNRLKHLRDAQGKKLLVWHEQGMGDTLQFSRYVRLLEEIGISVTFEVQSALYPLLKKQFQCSVVDHVSSLHEFDYQIPLLSLPSIFNTSLDTIPNIFNISLENSKINFWRGRLRKAPNKVNIGLAISGNCHHQDDSIRSMPLHFIKPLLEKANIFLLQKEIKESDQEFLKSNSGIFFLGSELEDFSDTAAIIEELDLIVSVDTSLIHLAGVLKKKSYLLLPKVPEWRWLVGREDTPWYENVTLIHQNSYGDWGSAILKLQKILN